MRTGVVYSAVLAGAANVAAAAAVQATNSTEPCAQVSVVAAGMFMQSQYSA